MLYLLGISFSTVLFSWCIFSIFLFLIFLCFQIQVCHLRACIIRSDFLPQYESLCILIDQFYPFTSIVIAIIIRLISTTILFYIFHLLYFLLFAFFILSSFPLSRSDFLLLVEKLYVLFLFQGSYLYSCLCISINSVNKSIIIISPNVTSTLILSLMPL